MTEFLPAQPNLYTVEAHGRSVVVISAYSVGPPPDELLSDSKMIEALRKMEEVEAQMADFLKQKGIDPSPRAPAQRACLCVRTIPLHGHPRCRGAPGVGPKPAGTSKNSRRSRHRSRSTGSHQKANGDPR